MCGRYTIDLTVEDWAELFGIEVMRMPSMTIRYNIPPSTYVPAIRLDADGKREMLPLYWNFRPAWKKTDDKGARPQQNARAESIVEEKPMFKKAFQSRRCIVPASGYFEWRPSDKQPYYFSRQDGQPIAFAGIWEGDTCATFTTTPNAECAPIHHRMPVILEMKDFARYLDLEPLTEADRDRLLSPSADGTLKLWPVTRDVGAVRNQGPELIVPVAPDLPLPTRPKRNVEAIERSQGDLFG